ncbi:MAG: DUF3667 domain-containing protein [Micropepsaceae bacterium]
MTVLPSCANCGTALNGPYCSNCGQKASDIHRPIWWIFGEFMDAIFGYDSRTFRTIWLLFAEPGEFTRRYIAGQRASMLPPFRLFVIATLLFFVTMQVTDLAIVAFKVRAATPGDYATAPVVQVGKSSAGKAKVPPTTVVDMDFFVPAESVQHVTLTAAQKREVLSEASHLEVDSRSADEEEKGWLRWLVAKANRVTQGYERALADPMKLNAPLNLWLPRLMLVLVPVFALLLAVMHWWPRVYIAEHVVFSVHVHTVVFVALSLTALTVAIVGDSGFLWAVWLILLVYLWMAMYRVYGRSWWLTTLKFGGLLAVYSVVLSAGLGTIFILALSEL